MTPQQEPNAKSMFPEIPGYTIVDRLNEGDAGIAYLAYERALDRQLVLKVLPFSLADDALRLKRFQNEIAAMTRLKHPHILPLIGVGQTAEHYYFAMPLVEGSRLSKTLADLDSPPNDAATDRRDSGSDSARSTRYGNGNASIEVIHRYIAWISTIARALHYAHGQGVVHGDVTADNLLVDQHGHVWIVNFEQATLLDLCETPRRDSGGPSNNQLTTQSSCQSDMVSLANVLKQVAAKCLGQNERSTKGATWPGRLTNWSQPRAPIVDEIWRRLTAVIAAATGDLSSQRYHSLQEFATALDEVAQVGLPIRARDGKPIVTAWSKAMLGMCGCLAAIVLFFQPNRPLELDGPHDEPTLAHPWTSENARAYAQQQLVALGIRDPRILSYDEEHGQGWVLATYREKSRTVLKFFIAQQTAIIQDEFPLDPAITEAGPIGHAVISGNHKWLALADAKGETHVVRMWPHKYLGRITIPDANEPESAVVPIAISQNGTYLLVSRGTQCFAIDPFNMRVLNAWSHPATAATFRADEGMLALAYEQQVFLYNPSNWESLKIALEHELPVTDLQFCEQGTYLFTIDTVGTVQGWNCSDQSVESRTRGSLAESIARSRIDRHMVASSHDLTKQLGLPHRLADWKLDTTFGEQGAAIASLVDGHDAPCDAVVARDGRMAIGLSPAGLSIESQQAEWGVAWLDQDGKSFVPHLRRGRGANQVQSLCRLRILEDGTLLSVGQSSGQGGDARHYGLMKQTNDHQMLWKAEFLDLPQGHTDLATGVAVHEPQGAFPRQFVVAGGSTSNYHDYIGVLVRYNDDGSIDRSYGTQGTVACDDRIGRTEDVAALADRSVVIAGTQEYRLRFGRITEQGKLRYMQAIPDENEPDVHLNGFRIAISADNRAAYVLGLRTRNDREQDFFVAKMVLEDGSLDRSFGNQGMVTIDLGEFETEPSQLALDAVGRIYVVGRAITVTKPGRQRRLALAVLAPDGRSVEAKVLGAEYTQGTAVLFDQQGHMTVIGALCFPYGSDTFAVRYSHESRMEMAR